MYPLFLDLKNRLVVVVGAGPVGRRKIAGLLACGARVRVVCLESASTQGVEWLSEPYESPTLQVQHWYSRQRRPMSAASGSRRSPIGRLGVQRQRRYG
jgi:siroheme synthase (precorrin-2 oxidase/ferrochelatase)